MSSSVATDYAELLRRDFSLMIRKCFRELNPHTPYLHNWHIDVMAEKLDACRQGKIKRLIINIPPRHLKSICASVALPAWWLGHNPATQIVCASYGQDLADKHAMDCRNIIQSPWYQTLFPNTRLLKNRQSIHDFATTQQGGRMATSVGGVFTGRGADVIIIDDPLKPDEAVSDTQRKNCNDWFDGTLYARLNSKRDGCIILIMQRLHEDDLSGHVLGQEPWETISFPAIADVDETHHICLSSDMYVHSRRGGEALHPERESIEILQHLKKTIGEYNFAGQYQQAPSPLGGGLIKTEWFKTYESGHLPEDFEQIVQSWDTANKEGELNDYSVCTTWGIKAKNIYLLHVYRRRVNFPDLKRAVKEQQEAFAATVVLIEDKASGTSLIQELVHEGLYCITKFVPEGSKLVRMHAQTGTIENGFVYLPKEAHWLPEFLHEFSTFPKGKHDDQVDSTSQALSWMKVSPFYAGWGLMQVYKEEAERIKAG